DKSYQTFFVNKRYVRNFLLNRALEDAYRTLIPHTRHPIAILSIEIDPKQVDVNVHPAKREVKFVKTNEVMQAIRDAVSRSLTPSHLPIRQAGPIPHPSSPTTPNSTWSPEMTEIFFGETNPSLATAMPEITIEISEDIPLTPIYQLKNTYIVATDGETLVLIDQHAAHERIIYDEIRKQKADRGAQEQLIPETLDFDPKEKQTLQDNLEYLNKIGFSLEEFGNNSYLLRSVPAQAAKALPKELLQDIISELQELGKSAQMEIKQENIRKAIACKAAIKAGDSLSAQEMVNLIKNLYQTENPATCPHGRPTMIKLSSDELHKRFGRT
ncbi:MAG: hypothetical protein KJ811_01520, partial [Candidatus Margulisbacteria bacterium]|nr:hypothetical protein [Candidatus Margulisiibacteriota bacterium]